MASASAPSEETTPIWEYVALADYDVPAEPVIHTARRGLAVLRNLLDRRKTESASPLKAADDLQMLSSAQLDRIAPAPAWAGAAAALRTKLAAWLERPVSEQPLQLLVGPPYSGYDSVLQAWATQYDWTVLHPPSPEQIFSQDAIWLVDQCNTGKPWVFPCLEKTYLRHVNGLGLVRDFLDRAYAGELGRGLIGCDSWAWLFLRHIWRGHVPAPLTLQAFDSSRLGRYFQCLAHAADSRQLLFRQSNNGNFVLPPPESVDDPAGTSNFLQYLAASSRGIAGVAQAIWRASLHTEPDVSLAEEAIVEEQQRANKTVWVTAWEQLTLPTVPSDADFGVPLVLHTLLLHNGLSLDLVQQLLPLSPDQILETLFRLEHAGLASRAAGTWRIAAVGYPAVRQFLKAYDYPVDPF